MGRTLWPLSIGVASAIVIAACSPAPPTDIAGEYYLNSVGSIGGRCVYGAPTDADLFDAYWSGSHMSYGPADAVEVTSDGALTEVSFQQGAVADYLDTFVGTTAFMGSVRDGHVEATLTGANVFQNGSCSYVVDAHLDLTFGTLLLTADSNVPHASGFIDSTPRAIAGACPFAACLQHSFVTVVEVTRLP